MTFLETKDFDLNLVPNDENSLKINTCQEDETERSRMTRRRSDRLLKRVVLQTATDDDFEKVQNYYLNRQVKRLSSKLETIFEEPKKGKREPLYMSSRKYKRVIRFDDVSASKEKLTKRQIKIKQISKKKQGKRKCRKSTPDIKQNKKTKTKK